MRSRSCCSRSIGPWKSPTITADPIQMHMAMARARQPMASTDSVNHPMSLMGSLSSPMDIHQTNPEKAVVERSMAPRVLTGRVAGLMQVGKT